MLGDRLITARRVGHLGLPPELGKVDHVQRVDLPAGVQTEGDKSLSETALPPDESEGVVVPMSQVAYQAAVLEHEPTCFTPDHRVAVQRIGVGAGVPLKREGR